MIKRLLALGVALTLAWPSSAFALRKSQETREPATLAATLRGGLEEDSAAVLAQLAGQLAAHGFSLRWDDDIPQDPALWQQVARWLATPQPPLAEAVTQLQQRYPVPVGWGLELRPAATPGEVSLAVPSAGADKPWVEYEAGQGNWMQYFLSRLREVQATKVWVNARRVSYQTVKEPRGEFHQLMPPEGLRQFLEDRDLEIALIIQAADAEAWNDARWLFDPRTARRTIPSEVVVVSSPEVRRTVLQGPSGPLRHLQGYYTRAHDNLPARFTILSTAYRVKVPALTHDVPAVLLDWEGPSGERRYRVDLREFSPRHPARRFMEFLAGHRIGNVGLLGGGPLSLMTGVHTDDLDLVPLAPRDRAQGFEGIGEDQEEWQQFLAALTPVVVAMRQDELITHRELEASLTALVQGKLRFDDIPLGARGMSMVAETGAPPRADLLPARLTIETLLLRPDLRQRTVAWLYDPDGGVDDLLAQRPRIVGYRQILARIDPRRGGIRPAIHRLFQILRRMASHRLNADWTPDTSEQSVVHLVYETLATWDQWLQASPPTPVDDEVVRAELVRFFDHVYPATDGAEQLLVDLGVLGGRRAGGLGVPVAVV